MIVETPPELAALFDRARDILNAKLEAKKLPTVRHVFEFRCSHCIRQALAEAAEMITGVEADLRPDGMLITVFEIDDDDAPPSPAVH